MQELNVHRKDWIKENITRHLYRLSPYFVFLIFILIALRRIIFLPGLVGWQWDWNLPPFTDQYAQLVYRQIGYWDHGYRFGAPWPWAADLYFNILLTMLSYILGILVSKGIVIFLMFFSACSMFYLIRTNGIGPIPSTIGALFYMFSPFMYSRIYAGHLAVVFGYALLPLFTAFLLKSLKNSRKNLYLSLACITFSLTLSHFMIFFISLVILIFISLFHFLLYFKNSNHAQKWRLIITPFIVIGFTFLLHGYWMFPAVANMFSPEQTIESYAYSPSALKHRLAAMKLSSSSLFQVFRLQTDSGMGTEFVFPLHDIPFDLWFFISSLIPIFAFLPILIARARNKNIILFAMLSLIGITLTAAWKSPFGEAYLWVMEIIPSLGVTFTNPNRWQPLIILSYSVLLSYSLRLIRTYFYQLRIEVNWKRLTNRKNITKKIKLKLPLDIPCIMSFFIICLIFLSPFLVSFSLPVYPVTEKTRALYDWIADQPGDFRIALLPPGGYTRYIGRSESHMEYLSTFPPKPDALARTFSGFEKQLFVTLYQPTIQTSYFGSILGLGNVKYVVFQDNRVVPNDYYNIKTDENEVLEKFLKSQIGLQKLDIPELKESSFLIYENRFYKDHLYPLSDGALIFGDRGSLISLSHIPKYLNKNALIYGTQLSREQFSDVLNIVDTVILYDDNYIDMIHPLLPDQYKIFPGFLVTEHIGGWSWEGWSNMIHYVLGDKHYPLVVDHNRIDPSARSMSEAAIAVQTNAKLNIPLFSEMTSPYEIFIKLHIGPQSGKVNININNTIVALNTYSPSDLGFKWFSLGTFPFSQGNHTIYLENEYGENVVWEIIFIPRDILKQIYSDIESKLQDKKLILLYEMEQAGNIYELLFSSSFEIPDADDTISDGWTIGHPVGVPLFSWDDDTSYEGSYSVKIKTKSEETVVGEWVCDPIRINPGQSIVATAYTKTNHVSNSEYEQIILTFRDDSGGPIYPEYESPRIYNATEWKKIEVSATSPSDAKALEIRLRSYLTNEKETWFDKVELLKVVDTLTTGDVSQGYAAPPSKLSLYSPKGGNHTTLIRTLIKEPTSLIMEANGVKKQLILTPKDNYSWFNLGQIEINKGNNSLHFHSTNQTIYIDQLIIHSVESGNFVEQDYVNMIDKEASTETLKSIAKDSGSYQIIVNSTSPFFLIFSETYDQKWRANVDGEVIWSIPAFGFANLFYVNKTGEVNIVITYQDLKNVKIGQQITLFAWVSVVAIVILSSIKVYRGARRYQ